MPVHEGTICARMLRDHLCPYVKGPSVSVSLSYWFVYQDKFDFLILMI